MDPILLISGALALLGGGAGAYAWYQKTYNPTPAQARDAAVAASGQAYTGPVVPASGSTPAVVHDIKAAASGTPYTGPFVAASSAPESRANLSPTVAITQAVARISGLEAHL